MWRKENEFCYPSDFYWYLKSLDKEKIKEECEINKIKTILILTIAILLGMCIIPTICMIIYYMTYPFKLLNNYCEDWCYR